MIHQRAKIRSFLTIEIEQSLGGKLYAAILEAFHALKAILKHAASGKLPIPQDTMAKLVGEIDIDDLVPVEFFR